MSQEAAPPTHVEHTLSPEVWGFVARAVQCAGRGDAAGHRDALLAFERDFPDSPFAGYYLWYLLRLQVRIRLGHMPDVTDLTRVVTEVRSNLARVVTVDDDRLQALLLTVFELPTEHKVVGGEAIVLGTALIGALTQPDAADLEAMRGQVERWLPRLNEAIRQL